MRVLLSTIGSRGDVQPLVALALELEALGQQVHLCAPPDFRDWIESLGLAMTPIGPEVRKAAAALPTPAGGTPERLRQLAEATVAAQFETIAAAARGCDAIVGATALQLAAPSVAERMGVPYVFAAYCPTVLPSAHHLPIPLGMRGDAPPAAADNAELWAADARRWNTMWGPVLNAHRAALGLAPIADVRGYVHTERPWLAADPTMGPWPDPSDERVYQPGAWILADDRPLSPELERFLDAGEPSVYFGFGSMRGQSDLARAMLESARALGRAAGRRPADV
jgi:vancomycin aglycone glucosyltransferase